jgi:hypothetical protein
MIRISKNSTLCSEHTAHPRGSCSLQFNIHRTVLLNRSEGKLHFTAQYEKAKLIDTLQILLFFFKCIIFLRKFASSAFRVCKNDLKNE